MTDRSVLRHHCICLTLNKNNEIVVLSVDSNELYVENFIKSRLNYKELPSLFSTKEKTFKVPVRVVAGEE